MNKSKFMLIVLLCLVVVAFSVTAPTYSWFNRPRTGEPREAGVLALDDDTIYGYNGYNVSATTHTSTDGGDTYSDDVITDFSSSQDGLGIGNKSLYRTTLVNNSDHVQNVSLYLRGLNIGFNTSSDFYVGTNSPVRSYRKYKTQEKQTISSYDTVRVYLDPNSHYVSSWRDYSTSIKIRYGTGTASSPNWVKVGGEEMSRVDASNHGINKRYFDLPLSATVVQFFANNDSSGSNATPYMSLSSYCGNLSAKQSYYFGVQANTVSYSNHNCDTGYANQPLLMSTFDDILLGVSEQTFSFTMTKDVDYTGASITASSSNSSIFSVTQSTDSDTTTITMKGEAAGTADLNLSIEGAMYHEARAYQIPVTVTQEGTITINEITIAKNILLQASGDANGQDIVNVDWYIKNDITGSGSLIYSIDGLYIGG